MSWVPFAVMILIFGLGLWVAIKIARAVQREVDSAQKDKKKQSRYHWVFGFFHWIWAGLIPAMKYVYREWKTAPPNSAEKFLWTMLLAATGAVAIWILIKILDRAINKETKPVMQPDGALSR